MTPDDEIRQIRDTQRLILRRLEPDIGRKPRATDSFCSHPLVKRVKSRGKNRGENT